MASSCGAQACPCGGWRGQGERTGVLLLFLSVVFLRACWLTLMEILTFERVHRLKPTGCVVLTAAEDAFSTRVPDGATRSWQIRSSQATFACHRPPSGELVGRAFRRSVEVVAAATGGSCACPTWRGCMLRLMAHSVKQTDGATDHGGSSQ